MVYVILCFHDVDNLLLIILVYHMHDLEFNNMFKFGFNLRNSKLGFMPSMNVFNWNWDFLIR